MEAAKQALIRLGINGTNPFLQIGVPIFFVIMMIIFFTMSTWYTNQYGLYRSNADSINQLLSLRRQKLSESIDPLRANSTSVSNSLLAKSEPYSRISGNSTALVNWRPLSVRMAGYLGGVHSVRDGVFDMSKGIQSAIHLGARLFTFDIDYMDNKPCEPRLIYRDDQGVMRSLHTGSILDGMAALNTYAFRENYDPVIIVLYLRRLPAGRVQKTNYFKELAIAMDPLTTYHLGSTEQGNFHNCRSEKHLFTSQITNFQKKFIVLCNYNTNILAPTLNPKNNLDFWINARVYLDPSGKSETLGTVTTLVPSGQMPYVKVAATQQLLQLPDANVADYLSSTSSVFTIALSSMSESFTAEQVGILLNSLGIQSVPLDILRLACTKDHENTRTPRQTVSSTGLYKPNPTLDMLSNATNSADPLSFWTYAGWSRKRIETEGFEDMKPVPVAANIPGFIIPAPVVPKKPPPSTNSNGGLVNIS